MMDTSNSPIERSLIAASSYTRCCYNITRLLSLVMAIIISKSLVALCAATPNQLDQQSSITSITNHHNYNHNHNLPLPVPEALLSQQSRPQQQQQDHHDDKVYNILKGDNVTFECLLEHHEADHAIWMYQPDVQEVPMFLAAKKSSQDFISTNNNKLSLISTGRMQKLTLHNVQPLDQGFYVCQIQNNAMRYNKPKSKFLLNVATKPTIEKIIEHIKTQGSPINNEHTITNNDFAPVLEYDSKSDSEIGLTCLATSEPAPQYKWYKYQQPKIVDSQTVSANCYHIYPILSLSHIDSCIS